MTRHEIIVFITYYNRYHIVRMFKALVIIDQDLYAHCTNLSYFYTKISRKMAYFNKS